VEERRGGKRKDEELKAKKGEKGVSERIEKK